MTAKRNPTQTSYTQITETTTFVIHQHTPTRFETFRIYKDADGQSVTCPKYFDTLEEAENHRNRIIILLTNTTK